MLIFSVFPQPDALARLAGYHPCLITANRTNTKQYEKQQVTIFARTVSLQWWKVYAIKKVLLQYVILKKIYIYIFAYETTLKTFFFITSAFVKCSLVFFSNHPMQIYHSDEQKYWNIGTLKLFDTHMGYFVQGLRPQGGFIWSLIQPLLLPFSDHNISFICEPIPYIYSDWNKFLSTFGWKCSVSLVSISQYWFVWLLTLILRGIMNII